MYQTILFQKSHNIHYLKRYITFITHCKQKDRKHGDNHHICPKAEDMFPEYSSFTLHKWNKVKLSKREHFIAHILLWKAYPKSQSQLYALNAMKNKNNIKINSRIFEQLKADISNFGLNKNIIVAKDKEGNVFRVTKEDHRWISGELAGVMKGVPVHQNIRDSASKRWKGVKKSIEQNNKCSKTNKLLKWYHNFTENRTGRYRENEQPINYVRVCGPHRLLTLEELENLKKEKIKIQKQIRYSRKEESRENRSEAQKNMWKKNPLRGIENSDLIFITEILKIYSQKPEISLLDKCNRKITYERAFAKEYSKIKNVSIHNILSIINGKKNRILKELKNTDTTLTHIINEILCTRPS